MNRRTLLPWFSVLLLLAGCASPPDDAESGVVCFVPAPPPDKGELAEHSAVLSGEAAQACLEKAREVGISAFSEESRPLTRGVLLRPQGAMEESKAQARDRGARWLAFVWLARIDAPDDEAFGQPAFRGKGFQLYDLHQGTNSGLAEGLPDGPAQAFDGYTILADDDPRSAPLAREEGLELMERCRAITAGFRDLLSEGNR